MAGRSSILFCFAGPGGSGKSTICEAVVAGDKKTRMSVSSTSRERRPDEVDGVDYNFLTREEFEERIGRGELIEYTCFNGNYYGTEKKVVEQAIADEVDLIFDVESEGIANLKRIFGEMVVTSFVFPPSWEVLAQRLNASGNRTEVEISERLEIARHEVELLSREGFSDYLLVNDRLEESIKAAHEIIGAERRKFRRLRKSFLL